MKIWIVRGLAVLVAAVAGCATSAADDASQAAAIASANGLPCAVDEVLAKDCRMCHSASPVYGAPMPLMTWEDLQAPARSNPAKKVHELVTKRVHDPVRPMPPMGVMEPAKLAVLDDWVAAGTPRGTAACGADAGADSGADAGPAGCTPDRTLLPPSAWTVSTTANDEYVCYGIDVTAAQKRHITAIAPKIDNHRVVHHMDLFQAPESFGAAPQACSAFASKTWRMVFAWAPGGENMVLPQAAGFPLEGTTHYVVQIHYSNINHTAGERDGSGFDLCTTDQLRANDADVMALGSEHFTVPPQSAYTLDCKTSVAAATSDIHVFGVMPHLHNYGTSLVQTLQPKDGSAPTVLASQPHWDIANQAWFKTSATIHPGDSLTTRCSWTNTSSGPVSFGDASTDEMCYAFTMYYPRITAPTWSWSAPAESSTCTPTAPASSH